MDLLQTSLWIEYIVDLENPEDKALCPTFALAGYTSMNSVSNLGSTFVNQYPILVITFLNLVLILTKLLNSFTCEKIKVLGTLEKYLDNILYWNFILRFFIQQYQAIFIAITVNLYIGLQNFSLTLEEYESITSTPGDKMSTYSSVIMLPICVCLPLAMTLIIHSYQSGRQLASSAFEKKFGTITEGLRISRRQRQGVKDLLAPYWNVFTLLRWGISIVIFVYFKDSPGLQISLLYVLSVFMQGLLLYLKPIAWTGFHQKCAVPLEENYFKFVNEFLITCYLLLSVSLTDYNTYTDLRDNNNIHPPTIYAFNLGLLVLSTILICVLANIIRALAIAYLELTLMLKRKKYNSYLKFLEQRRLDAIVDEELRLKREFEGAMANTDGVQVKGRYVIDQEGRRVPYQFELINQFQKQPNYNKSEAEKIEKVEKIVKEVNNLYYEEGLQINGYKQFDFVPDSKDDEQQLTEDNLIEIKPKETSNDEGIWKHSATTITKKRELGILFVSETPLEPKELESKPLILKTEVQFRQVTLISFNNCKIQDQDRNRSEPVVAADGKDSQHKGRVRAGNMLIRDKVYPETPSRCHEQQPRAQQ